MTYGQGREGRGGGEEIEFDIWERKRREGKGEKVVAMSELSFWRYFCVTSSQVRTQDAIERTKEKKTFFVHNTNSFANYELDILQF